MIVGTRIRMSVCKCQDYSKIFPWKTTHCMVYPLEYIPILRNYLYIRTQHSLVGFENMLLIRVRMKKYKLGMHRRARAIDCSVVSRSVVVNLPLIQHKERTTTAKLRPTMTTGQQRQHRQQQSQKSWRCLQNKQAPALLIFLIFSCTFHSSVSFTLPSNQVSLYPKHHQLQRQIQLQHVDHDSSCYVDQFSRRCLTLQLSRNSNKNKNNNKTNKNKRNSFYNDDCFGLIFLSGAIAANDIPFSILFMILSGVAATVTRTKKQEKIILPSNNSNNNNNGYDTTYINNTRKIPALVAAITFIINFFAYKIGLFENVSQQLEDIIIAQQQLSSSSLSYELIRNDEATMIEFIICSISVIYGFVLTGENEQ